MNNLITYFKYTVPDSFKSDGCTYARDSWFGVSIKNACIYHDYLRREKIVSKGKANKLFYKALRQDGLFLPIAVMYYCGVVLAGVGYE